MNNKAFYNLTYGVFLLATKAGEKANACIVNTGVQVAGSPVRVAVSVLNTNYTCALIKESGRFTLSALDDSCSFETIKHFGIYDIFSKGASFLGSAVIAAVKLAGGTINVAVACLAVFFALGFLFLRIADKQKAIR